MNMDDEKISAVGLRRDAMLEPDEVTAMLRLRKLAGAASACPRSAGLTVQRMTISGRLWLGSLLTANRNSRLGSAWHDSRVACDGGGWLTACLLS